jgi:hypothetical protein
MKILNKYKASILRFIGIAIAITTILSLYNGKITWIWEGLTGISICVLLIWMPESIAKLILGVFNKLTNKLLNGDKEQVS